MARWILHADMDAFYASIEQRDHPELRGQPVIVGGTSARGVVAAASYEARAHGVRSAMPVFRARELCPHGVFISSNIAHYAAVSADVHRVFEELTPDIEPLALDEAFLDVTASVKLFGGPLAVAQQLKARVTDATGLRVSVGLAPNKLVAKIACSLSKPDGLLIVPPEAIRWLLDPLPIRRLWGVGPVTAERLEAVGVRTFAGLRSADETRLAEVLGDRTRAMQRLAGGEDERPVESDLAPKSFGEENTFVTDISLREAVTAALTAHSEAVARRMRRAGYRGRTVTVKIKLARRGGVRSARLAGETDEPRYPVLTRSRTLVSATDDGAIIREVAIALWDAARIDEPVRLLGVSLSSLEPRDFEQLVLFDPHPRAARLGPALDAIRERFGADAIGRAVEEPGKLTPSLRKKRGE